MSEQESPRLIALREAVENCIKAGLSESEIVAITRIEVFGAKLRAAVQECLTTPKPVKLNYYQYAVDKKITAEEILAVVQAVQVNK